MFHATLNTLQVLNRHGDDEQGQQFAEMMVKFFDLYEPASADEKNAYNIDITEDMSVEDVLKEVLKIVEKVWKITKQINFDIIDGLSINTILLF